MLHKEYWSFNQHWLDYVIRTWQGRGRVEQIKAETPESIEFRKRAFQSFFEQGVDFRYVKTYLSVQVPKQGEGYDEQYPHTHVPDYATTLVHYLQPGDVPAPLDVFDGDKVIETIYPEPGLTVFIPNSTLHGVRKNQGTTNRIQLIATALR
jgi:hypothetical protein